MEREIVYKRDVERAKRKELIKKFEDELSGINNSTFDGYTAQEVEIIKMARKVDLFCRLQVELIKQMK